MTIIVGISTSQIEEEKPLLPLHELTYALVVTSKFYGYHVHSKVEPRVLIMSSSSSEDYFIDVPQTTRGL